ncbi:hypothetical protein GCM10022243_01470 [Saccharothrix violaceirubra]|uniref:Uncharacterized protein n=1 Tax=Saccharothrix violaceirubra TaxID=413306 RepID=A0A7W7T2I1_9PSEU|nr:hypothetical protein [Saccharothrix violaceirubra]MBB4965353.1 hypothetical protein [Saccharothrix violaceirubra]
MLHAPAYWDFLTASASAASARPRRLDGWRLAYLVEGGPVDVFGVRELPDGRRSRRRFVARCPVFSAVPPPALTGEWQLYAVPLPGGRLRELHEPGFPWWAALAPALDRALQAMSGRTRPAHPPRDSVPLWPGPLAAGRSALCVRRPLWLWARGGFRVNGGDVVTARRDAVLLTAGDWIGAEDDCVLALRTTEEVLRAGGLTDVVGGHLTRLAWAAMAEARADDERLLAALAERRRAHRSALAATAHRALGELGLGARTGPVDRTGGGPRGPVVRSGEPRDLAGRAGGEPQDLMGRAGGEPHDVLRAVTGWGR